ncbi:MAG: hypothetical protein JNK48_24805 [Bryobacterales bacterium]|nr:hypothetical protein [Bryobacterales bacterium]
MQIFLFFLEIATLGLPTAIVHKPYHHDPIIALGPSRCGLNSQQFRVVLGELPPGMLLHASGYLSGTPSRTGSFQFLVRVGNDCEHATRLFELKVEGAPILVHAPDSLEFEYTINGPLPEPQTVVVSSSWPDMPYGIEAAGADWLDAQALRGRTQIPDGGHAGDPVTIRIEPGKLKPGTYRTALRVSAWQSANSPLIPVTLKIHPPK